MCNSKPRVKDTSGVNVGDCGTLQCIHEIDRSFAELGETRSGCIRGRRLFPT